MSRCRVQAAEAGGRCHVPSSSTVSTTGDDKAKCAQNGKKEGNSGLMELHHIRPSVTSSSRSIKMCSIKTDLLLCSKDVASKNCSFLPCSKDGASKTPFSKYCCSFTSYCKGKLVSVLEASAISSFMLWVLLRSWLSEGF